MQLITIKRIIGIPSASASTLCRFGVFVVDEVASVTKFWCPICIGPNACSFAVVCTIHTIIDAHKGQALNNGACLQKPRIWVFQEPYGWVQVVDQGQASLHKRICFVQVPWGFCSRASPAVLRTVWGRPNHVKVPRLVGTLPGHNINAVCRPKEWVPIHLNYVVACFDKRFGN